MAELFDKQAKEYAESRPTYPTKLFEFIASKTPCRDLVWDVGTGSGQAIPPVRHVLKKPNGVLAAWCSSPLPKISTAVDVVFKQLYEVNSAPYWEEAREVIDDKYKRIDFPFEPVEGLDSTGPFELWTDKEMDLDGVFKYVRSWSAYNTAKEEGVELLDEEMVRKFEKTWDEDGGGVKVAKFLVSLKIGRVGDRN